MFEWNDDLVEKLKELWKKGISAKKIGDSLGTTKGSVIGKVHRLGLEQRGAVIKSKKEFAPKKESKIKQEKLKKEEKKEVIFDTTNKRFSNKNSLLNLKNNQCHWPIGDPKDEDFHFCGEDTIEGKPYCLKHCMFAYSSKVV